MSRGCGSRAAGGLYFVVKPCRRLSDLSRPLDDFLLCPPWPVDRVSAGIPARGVAIIERPGLPGVFDVWDHVGSEHYPNVADMLEEGRKMGFSRRASNTMDYSMLTPKSRLILLHNKTVAVNAQAAWAPLAEERLRLDETPLLPKCRARKAAHFPLTDYGQTCSALWYEDIRGDVAWDPKSDRPRDILRTIGSTTYAARRWFAKGDMVEAPRIVWAPGAFVMLPLQGFEVVGDGGSEREQKSLAAASRSTLPVEVVEEEDDDEFDEE